MFVQSISLEASTSTSGFETDSDQVKLFVEAERLCLELQKNYREFGAGLALRQSVVTGNGRRKKTAASQLSSEDYLKLRWCLEKRSSLRLEKAYLHRWAVMKKIRTEVTEIFDELTTLSDYLTKGMSLEIDLKHTYLEYLPSHAKSLKVEVTYWAQIHQYILHNRWLKKAECLRAFWAQTRRYIATVAYVLKVIQQLMVGGLTMFTKISSNLQKLNIPTFTNDFCIATSDYNTVVKEISWIYDSLTLISPCHRTKLPATLSISEILTAVAKSDALIQSTLIIKELAIKPNSLLSNLKQMNFKDIFVRLNSQVQKPNGSSLPPIPTMKKATKPKKAVDGGTSDYSSMSGSTVSDGIETPDLESSLITSASSKALVAKLKSFHQQRNLVLSELLDSATKHRSIADSKLKTKPVKKGVSWLEDAVNEQKQEILLVYSQDFWMETAKHLNILLTYGSIGSYHLPKSSLNSSLAPALVAKSVSDMFQRGLGEICSSLQQLPTVQALDYGWRLFEIEFLKLLYEKSIDKCEPVPMANGEFASKTATLITEIRNHLDLMSSAVADSDQFDPAYGMIDNLSQCWLKDKFIRSISSNSFPSVILIRFCDFPKLCEPTSALKKFMDSSINEKIKANCTEVLKETFPNKKFWSSTGKSASNGYVEYLVESVVEPIFEPLKLIKEEDKVDYIDQCTTAIYQSWVKYIFEKEFQFSKTSASLLQSDFDKLKSELAKRAKLEEKFLNDLSLFPYLQQAICVLESEDSQQKRSSSALMRLNKNRVEPSMEFQLDSVIEGFPTLDKWVKLRLKAHFFLCSCLS